MGQRSFRDENGRMWEVWDVRPTSTERRRRNTPVPVERRVRNTGPRLVVPPSLRDGWLAFQSKNERRVLAPVPKNWIEMSDAELVGLLSQAESKGHPRRLIE
jgi:hypothetical protein